MLPHSNQFPSTGIKRPVLKSHKIFNRRTIPNQPKEINILSHNKIIRYGVPLSEFESEEMRILRGSSINRKKEKNEIAERQKEAKKNVWSSIDGLEGKWRIQSKDDILPGVKTIKYFYYGINGVIRVPPGYCVCIRFYIARNKRVSPRTAEKIRGKAAAFFRIIPENCRKFLTLSFLDFVSHRRANKILDNFFKQLRKTYPELEYLWVCELQKNGNKHFHILINTFIPVFRINALWVLNQYNQGLVGYSRKHKRYITRDEILLRHKISLQNEAMGNKKDTGGIGEIFNPVDIKKIRETNGVIYYITKYLNKARNQDFDGLKFHCSRGVSKLFTKMVVDDDIFEELSDPDRNFYVNKKTGEVISPTPWFSKYAVSINIFNKKLSEKHLYYMDYVNRLILYKKIPPEYPSFMVYRIADILKN